MVNLTHRAIELSARDNGVYGNDFELGFVNASWSTVQYTLSTDYILYLTALKYVIQNEDDDINQVIKNRVTNLYQKGSTSETMVVTISLDKLSH